MLRKSEATLKRGKNELPCLSQAMPCAWQGAIQNRDISTQFTPLRKLSPDYSE